MLRCTAPGCAWSFASLALLGLPKARKRTFVKLKLEEVSTNTATTATAAATATTTTTTTTSTGTCFQYAAFRVSDRVRLIGLFYSLHFSLSRSSSRPSWADRLSLHAAAALVASAGATWRRQVGQRRLYRGEAKREG